jgi:hypothetical protein
MLDHVDNLPACTCSIATLHLQKRYQRSIWYGAPNVLQTVHKLTCLAALRIYKLAPFNRYRTRSVQVRGHDRRGAHPGKRRHAYIV